jgi:hypothetical protein
MTIMRMIEMIIAYFKEDEERKWLWLIPYIFCASTALILALFVRNTILSFENDNFSANMVFGITLAVSFAVFMLIRLLLSYLITRVPFFKNKSSISEKVETELCANANSKEVKFTTNQQVLLFHYLFNEIGITDANTSLSERKRFIRAFTGKNEQDIKEKLRFDYDDRKTKRDLRIVAENITELMPKIASKIENDMKE